MNKLVVIVFMVLGIAIFVSAQYPLQIYGTLSQGDNPVPDGTTVTFLSNGNVLLRAATKYARYGYDEPLFIDGELLTVGDVISIEVNGRLIYDVTYLGGADLGVDLEVPATVPLVGAATVCIANWQCSDWSACINNVQTRTCIDSNRCGSNINKPIEEKDCIASSITTSGPSAPAVVPETLPGAGIPEQKTYAWVYYVLGLAAVLIIVVIIFKKVQNRHVPDQQPHKFVHLSLKAGHHENMIKSKLVDQGWEKKHVENVVQVEKLRHYIINELNRGVDKNELIEYLVNYGWDRNVVERLMP